LKPLLEHAVASGEAAVESKIESARVAGAAVGVAAPAQKVARSLFLFVHLLILCFVIGDYFLFSSDVPTGGVLCRPARLAAIFFYKPFLVSSMYCLNFLVDAQGWMLFHNPVTDTIVLVLMALLFVYLAITAIFAVPILLSFAYLFLVFFIPPVAYVFAQGYDEVYTATFKPGTMKDPNDEAKWKNDWKDEAKRDEAFAAAVIFKRLSFYSFFAAIVSSVGFWPFYLGDSYVSVLERAVEDMVPSLQLWSPEFSLLFRFPDVSLHLQVSLAVSFGAMSLEYALLGWALLLEHLYPQGWATAYDSAKYIHADKAASAAVDAAADHNLVEAPEEAAALAVEALGVTPTFDRAGALQIERGAPAQRPREAPRHQGRQGQGRRQGRGAIDRGIEEI